MSDFRPSTKEEFVEEFLAFQPAGEEGESLRAILRRENKTKQQLAEAIKSFINSVPPATPADEESKEDELGEVNSVAVASKLKAVTSHESVSTNDSDASEVYSPFEKNGTQFKLEFIQEVQNQAGMNVIRKNPLNTWTAAGIVAVSAFALPLIAFVIFEAITGTTAMAAILPFLPFLAALTPVGAALAFAGLIVAASMIIFAITVGITAGASHRNVKIEDDVAPPPAKTSVREVTLGLPPSASADQNDLNPGEPSSPIILDKSPMSEQGGAQQHIAPRGTPIPENIAESDHAVTVLTSNFIHEGASHTNVKIEDDVAPPPAKTSVREVTLGLPPSASADQNDLNPGEPSSPIILDKSPMSQLGGAQQHIAPQGTPTPEKIFKSEHAGSTLTSDSILDVNTL